MIGALKTAAEALALAAPDIAAGSGKGLEAEVLYSLAAQAKRSRYEVESRNHKGHLLGNGSFTLRGGPGHLADPKSPGRKPSYFSVAYEGVVLFELHNSLEYRGSSGSDHEVDVSAVWSADADSVRAAGGGVLDGPPIIGIELKEFAASSTLDKNIVRAFVACVVDFIPTWTICWMSLGGRNFRRDFAAEQRPSEQFWILTTGEVSGPSHKFANANDIQVVDKLNLETFDAAISAMVGRLHSLALFHRRRRLPERAPTAPRALPSIRATVRRPG